MNDDVPRSRDEIEKALIEIAVEGWRFRHSKRTLRRRDAGQSSGRGRGMQRALSEASKEGMSFTAFA
jgi:hypothetical protein